MSGGQPNRYSVDVGKAAGSGAYLTALRRTSIGPYSIEAAWDLERLVEELSNKNGMGEKQ